MASKADETLTKTCWNRICRNRNFRERNKRFTVFFPSPWVLLPMARFTAIA